MSGKTFQNVQALRPGMSVFDLSYIKTFTADMGQLIPVMADEMVPGDIFKIGNQSVIRFQPLVAPILHEINAYVHYFFVPYRLLWDYWENFISGGPDGQDAHTIPVWTTSNPDIGSLWDYLGYPTGVAPTPETSPMAFPKRAYNLIYNEYYRDENLQNVVPIDSGELLSRNWEKDYFTSSLPWQQRGTAPALPISGTTHAVWADASILADQATALPAPGFPNAITDSYAHFKTTENLSAARFKGFMNSNSVDLSSATTFNVADLRLVFQIQKWMERNARSGVRYTEFLRSHFGVSPRDERLQRPEYVGGSKSPIIISEVLQTSETGSSPQGNMSGHGISASSTFCGKYRATEYGVMMGIMSIMPRTMYQQGLQRQWTRRTRYDFYFPEFANLSEQAVLNKEVYVTGNDTNDKMIFGYQGRYDEMRTKQNMVCGQMKSIFSYWHLGRIFSAQPALNSTFVKCVPRKDIFAAPTEPGLIVQFANLIKAWRPMPIQSNPGLIDHA